MVKHSTAEKIIHSAESAFENAQHVANGAIDGMTNALDQGMEQARQASQQLRESAHNASLVTSNAIRHDPLKSVLIAAATGAAITALISMLLRSQNR